MRNSYAFDKIRGVELPHPLLKKVGVVLLGILVLNTERNKPNFLRDEMFFVLPAKHGRHIRIMTPSASVSSSRHHTFGFRSITFEGMH